VGSRCDGACPQAPHVFVNSRVTTCYLEVIFKKPARACCESGVLPVS